MRIQQVEEKVLRAIDSILSGASVEDSRIECKRNWPTIDKVRQLAAHANSAQGEPIIWIIGVDKKGRKVTGFDASVDASDWWPQFEKKFDQSVAPDLLHSVAVTPEDHPQVMALAFDTSRAPYVINLDPGGKTQKEVPIRKSTGTRSASRNDLLRILVPLIRLPEVSIIGAELNPNYNRVANESTGRMEFALSLKLFFTYSGDTPVFLPQHRMRASLAMEFDNRRPLTLSCCPDVYVSRDAPTPPRFGVHRRRDGFGITGSGQQHLQCGFSSTVDLRSELDFCHSLNVDIKFPIAGEDRYLEDSVELEPSSGPFKPTSEGPHWWDLRGWHMKNN